MGHSEGSWTKEYMEGWLINGCIHVPDFYEEYNDDANLIVAAPDLLSACLMAYEELVFGGDWEAARRVIDAALAKAKGSA